MGFTLSEYSKIQRNVLRIEVEREDLEHLTNDELKSIVKNFEELIENVDGIFFVRHEFLLVDMKDVFLKELKTREEE